MEETFDLLVVGGGINGVGIARDAAGRGLRVALCEKDDLAQATSSRSSKLIHGGLRYLETYTFRLVREALEEREVLLRAAPHIIWPMRFVLPHTPAQRPRWLVRLGLFLYDHLGGRQRLPGTRTLDLARDAEGAPVRTQYRTGFAYSDCWCDDARLVVLNALDAAERGARVMPRTRLVAAAREGGLWRAELRARDGTGTNLRARALVNAAGPWVEGIVARAGARTGRHARLVKGSHLVLRKFWDGPQAYILQNHDGRVVFAIPYEGAHALVGTTDIPYEGDAGEARISEAETDYLLDALGAVFKRRPTRADIVHSYSGVRSLYDDDSASASSVSRDYVLNLDPERPGGGEAPLLSVFGGKITTYRRLAESALARLAPFFPAAGPAWTAGAPLPGGDMPGADYEAFRAGLAAAHPGLPEALRTHYGRLYGTRALALLDGVRTTDDLGRHWGGLLYEREVDYLRRHEWAERADDILWRRTKHGLHLSAHERAAFAGALDGRAAA